MSKRPRDENESTSRQRKKGKTETARKIAVQSPVGSSDVVQAAAESSTQFWFFFLADEAWYIEFRHEWATFASWCRKICWSVLCLSRYDVVAKWLSSLEPLKSILCTKQWWIRGMIAYVQEMINNIVFSKGKFFTSCLANSSSSPSAPSCKS